MTTATAQGGHSAPLGLMSCVRESSPQDMLPQTDLDMERTEPSKKRRFHPFRNLRKIFRRTPPSPTPVSVPSGEDVQIPAASPQVSGGHRSRSTSELLADQPRTKPQAPSGPLGGGALSVSHDSVFTEHRSTSSVDTQSTESLSVKQLMNQTGVRAELLDVVRRRGRGRGDTSEDEEDLGLPRSPCNSPTTTDKALKEHPTKSHSTCSDGSLLSMGSSEMDEDSFGQQSRHSSKLSLQNSVTADSELELGASNNATPLSHSAARHKMSVRPKRTHGAPRRRRVQQLTAGSALPTTPEVNEEVPTRSITPEGTNTRETVCELYSSSSSMQEWNSVSETHLKSASLPVGLALSSTGSKLARSRSNARDTFLEEDENDTHDKKKEDSFFGRFLARRSGKKKKAKSEEESYKSERIFKSGPAARQRVQPIDIPNSPEAMRHKRQQQIDLDLPMPPTRSPSPPKKTFLPETKVTSPQIPIPSPRNILPKTQPSSPEIVPTVRTILPQSYSPPKAPEVFKVPEVPKAPEVIPRNILPQKTETIKVEECKTKVKITGLSSYQQKVMSYNDEFDSFKSLEESTEDTTFSLTKSQSFRGKTIINSTPDHSSLPFTVNSSLYDSETFTDSLMSAHETQQVSVTINKEENVSKEENEVKIINTNAETVKIAEIITKSEEVTKNEENIENGITISCVNTQMQASVNTKSSNQVIVSISNSEPEESTPQVSVTKVQLKTQSKSPDSTTQIPEFLKIQLNKVDAKPATNVVLSTSNSFNKADDKIKQKTIEKSVLEIETDRENGEIDTVKRKFSADDVEIIDKDSSEEIVQVSKVSVTNIKPQLRKSSLITPVSTQIKPFLKKKSNSLELDSIKLEDKTKLATSADQLSKDAESTEVILRKKSLQKRDNSDEPELMKVFARRSLKLKDSEAETLSQQVLVLVEAEQAENNKRDSDKENDCNEQEERKKSKEKTKEPLVESKEDVTLRKPSSVLNNKLSLFGSSKYQRTTSLQSPAPNNNEEEEKRRNKSFCETKSEKKPVISNFKSTHIIKDKNQDIKTKVGDEIITSSLKKDFENEDYVPRFKRIQQRKEEWEQRAQQNMKKTVP